MVGGAEIEGDLGSQKFGTGGGRNPVCGGGGEVDATGIQVKN